MIKCYLCGSVSYSIKNECTRDNKKLKVLQCKKCSLTFLGSFKHLKNFSYKDSHNNYEKEIKTITDYKKLCDGLMVDDRRRFTQFKSIITGKKVLDFGSGAGGFAKLAKKVASSVVGVEVDSVTRFYNDKILVKEDIKGFSEKFDVITVFHVLEHLPDPMAMLGELKSYLKPNGRLIIEVPNDDDALISYYKLPAFKNFTYWSLHLFSFNKKTLEKICRRAGYHNVKISYVQRYSLANHIGWLKDGKPGGHLIFRELRNPDLEKIYNKQLALIGASDTMVGIVKV